MLASVLAWIAVFPRLVLDLPLWPCTNVSHVRDANNEKHRDRKPHRPAGKEKCLRSRCKVGCRAARAGLVAEVDQNLVQSSRLNDTEVWQKSGKPDVPSYGVWNEWELGNVVVHRPVGQEADERSEESSGVGNTCHERRFDQWRGEGQQATLRCTYGDLFPLVVRHSTFHPVLCTRCSLLVSEVCLSLSLGECLIQFAFLSVFLSMSRITLARIHSSEG